MKTRRLIALAALSWGALSASAAQAAPFQCSASAVRGTVLTQSGIEPVVAGTGTDCRSDNVKDNLTGPLGGLAAATTDLTGPADDPTRQHAMAGAGIEGLSIGSLRNLPISLPAAELPSGLDAIRVPLTGIASRQVSLPSLPSVPSVPTDPTTILPSLPTDPTGVLPSGLPSVITVDATEAARKLVADRQLPDVPLAAVDRLRSFVGAQCLNGLPDLVGNSVVSGLRGLGDVLSSDQPVDKAVTLLEGQTIPLSSIAPDAVKLPAGLSLSDPVTGAILRDAIAKALAGLPPIVVPPTVGRVTTTPAEQQAGNGSLEQHALRMQISAAGQQVADLVLGIAKVATDGLKCGKQAVDAAAGSAPDAAPVAPASQLAVSCSKQKVTLINVIDAGDHVRLQGAADQKLVGRAVRIVFTATGKQVATTTVGKSGFFSATAGVPAKALRYTSKARYVAYVGGEQSMPLKLHRRMRFSVLRHSGRKVVLVGRVFGPRTRRSIEIRQRISCTKDIVVGHVKPERDGTWRVALNAPKGTRAAVYRATTSVRPDNGGSKRFPTFTLPGYVSL